MHVLLVLKIIWPYITLGLLLLALGRMLTIKESK